jgi:hypothetical protein
MESGRWGGNNNEGYKPYVTQLAAMPGKVISEVEVAGTRRLRDLQIRGLQLQ